MPAEDFARIVDARRCGWNLSLDALEELGMAATCALLCGGELALAPDDVRRVLAALRLDDVVVGDKLVWLFVRPDHCERAYPIALGPATAIWVLAYLVRWCRERRPWPGSRPFAGIDLARVVNVARTQVVGLSKLRLDDLVAGNRDYLRRHYPPETVAYLMAQWRHLTIACPAWPLPKPLRIERPRAALPILDRLMDQLSRAGTDEYLAPRKVADALDVDLANWLGGRGCDVPDLKNELTACLSDYALALDRDPRELQEPIAVLVVQQLVAKKGRGRVASTMMKYLDALRVWMGQAGDQPFWAIRQDGQSSADLVIWHAVQKVVQRHAWPGQIAPLAPRPVIDTTKRVQYRALPLQPIALWLWSIEQKNWPEDQKRSLQWQFLLATRMRSTAIGRASFNQVLGINRSGDRFVDIVVERDKGKGGTRTLDLAASEADQRGRAVWEAMLAWLMVKAAAGAEKISQPDPNGSVYSLGGFLRRIGWPKGCRVHDIRGLACSLEYLARVPLLEIARKMAHATPETTLEDYVATRHLRQGIFAGWRAVDLPAQVKRQLTGYPERVDPAVEGDILPIQDIRALPLVCFRPLSLLGEEVSQHDDDVPSRAA
ncbi:MAG: hypothetical protein ACRDHX_09700 [Chloroflexota bacterium]